MLNSSEISVTHPLSSSASTANSVADNIKGSTSVLDVKLKFPGFSSVQRLKIPFQIYSHFSSRCIISFKRNNAGMDNAWSATSKVGRKTSLISVELISFD